MKVGKSRQKLREGQEGALPGCEELSNVEDTVEEGEDAVESSGLVLTVEVVDGVGLGLMVGSVVEETVEVAADGNQVLSGVLGAGGELGRVDILVSMTSVLLAGLASLEIEVLEVTLVDALAVVFCVGSGSTTCGVVIFLWVEAAGRKRQVSLL